MKSTKIKILLVVLLFIAIFSISPKITYAATTYTSGDYTYTVSNGKAKITKYDGSDFIVSIPTKLGRYEVNEIGDYAFKNCTEIEELKIPATIAKIGSNSFYGCNFTKVTFASNCKITTIVGFENMDKLTSINIPSNVKTIGYRAFMDDTALTSIVIPNGVTKIESDALAGCTGIEEIYIPTSVSIIDSYAFHGCNFKKVTFADNCKITTMSNDIFANMDKLTNINIPSNVRVIGDNAFGYDTALTSIVIPNSVTKIGHNAFQRCTGIKELYIPSNVEEIDSYAFNDCNFTKVKFADDCKITKIDGFGNMDKLTSINIPSNVRVIEDGAFGYDTALTSIVIPNSVTKIGHNAFQRCTSIKELYIPRRVEEIDSYAFNDCNFTKVTFAEDCMIEEFPSFSDMKSLTQINIPRSVKTIESGTFGYDTALASIVIPNSVTKIGHNAFQRCTNITVQIPKSVIEIDNYAFNNATGVNVVCESGSYAQNYCIEKNIAYRTKTFEPVKIPVSISKCSITGYITKTYTGKPLEQNLKITYNGKTLTKGIDYVVEYSNNVGIGTASMEIIGFGDYIGKVNKNFKILPTKPTGLKASSTTTTVTLSWARNAGTISGYKIYRYDDSKKAYLLIGTTSATSYKISNLKSGTIYKYAIKAYYNNNGTTYASTAYSSIFTSSTRPSTPKISKLTTKSKKATVKWNKISGASGYEVCMATSSKGTYKNIKTVTSGKTISYTKTKLKKGKKYYFKVRAYKTVNGKKVYSSYSSVKSIKIK